MKIVQITPGAGKMYCGGCFRDNALVTELRKQRHTVTMIPLYLPLSLEQEDQSQDVPIFFSGISVYLEQKSAFFRKAPRWIHKILASPALLKMAAGSAAKTNPADVGDLTISMLRGEEGNQAQELDALIEWLKQSEKPDIISLSNVLLIGMVRRLKAELNVPIICSLQGEDSFLNALPERVQDLAWQTLTERAVDVDTFIAPSFYFADRMGKRLRIPTEKMKVVHNGIDIAGYADARPDNSKTPPVLGFFARMCPEKGLDVLVDAFIELRQRGTVKNLQLKIGGSSGPADEKFVNEQKGKLKAAGLSNSVTFHPNVTRAEKIEFLKSLTVFSVPALYGEAFGLYVIEALAAGTPVVQPRHGAFPELLRASGGGGIICDPNPKSLAAGIEELLLNPTRARELGTMGQIGVQQKLTSHHMASEIAQLCRQAIASKSRVAA